MKIVLDSNIIIAAYAARGLCNALFELCLFEHKIVISKTLLKEVEEGLEKHLKLPNPLKQEIISFLQAETELVTPAQIPENACRDPDDIEILGVALSSRASAIVTGDKDLLVIKNFQSIPILSVREFWKFIRKQQK